MMKLCTLVLAAGAALGSTSAIADGEPEVVIRMVILGSDSGERVFTASAISVSAGVGDETVGGYVGNPETGAIGTAAFAGNSVGMDPASILPGFHTSGSAYETLVCLSEENCP
jgi:hypothetical protein